MKSIFDEVINIKPNCNVLYKVVEILSPLVFFFSSQNELEHWRKENLILKLESKFGFYRVLLTSLNISPKTPTLTVFEKQIFPDLEKTDSQKESSCPYWTI